MCEPSSPLTAREREVVRLVSEGCANVLIARALNVSERTVHAHVAHAMRKTGTVTRTQPAIAAIHSGMVTPGRLPAVPAPAVSIPPALASAVHGNSRTSPRPGAAGGPCRQAPALPSAADRVISLTDEEPRTITPARVWIREPGLPPRSAPLAGERTIIGRGDHCDVRLEHATVSWDHVELTRHGATLMAADLGSRNGTTLNGRPLEGVTRVRHGDTLGVGSVQVEVSALAEARGATVVASGPPVVLTGEERELAAALVSRYRDPSALAPRPANRAELAGMLFVSERTVQRRLDQLARKLRVPADAGRDRAILVAQRILQLGLDRQR